MRDSDLFSQDIDKLDQSLDEAFAVLQLKRQRQASEGTEAPIKEELSAASLVGMTTHAVCPDRECREVDCLMERLREAERRVSEFERRASELLFDFDRIRESKLRFRDWGETSDGLTLTTTYGDDLLSAEAMRVLLFPLMFPPRPHEEEG